MPAEFAEAYVKRGEVLFRALSYYKDFEDDGVRADEFEGTRVHLPNEGLKATKVDTGEVVSLPHTFESSAHEEDIFVHCLSTKFSEKLAEKFGTKTCIEIFEPSKFLTMIRAALERRPSVKDKSLAFGPIKYYAWHDAPLGDWALPERIALSKMDMLAWQCEYRIAFSVNHAFDFENVSVKLVPPGTRRNHSAIDHPKKFLKLGSLSKLCRVHSF
jgi:hypothetical protein